MIKLFEVHLAQNGWIVIEPKIDEEHIDITNLFYEDKEGIEDFLYHIAERSGLFSGEATNYEIKLKVRKRKNK